LHGIPDVKKVKYVSGKRWCSALKTVRFSMYRTWRRRCFNNSAQCSFWKICCIILILLQQLKQLKTKNISPNDIVLRHKSHCH